MSCAWSQLCGGGQNRECVAAESRHVPARWGAANEFIQNGPLRRALDWRARGVNTARAYAERTISPDQIPPGSARGAAALVEGARRWLFHFEIKINTSEWTH